MNEEINQPVEIDDNTGICLREHLLIRDADTKEVLVDQSGSTKKHDEGFDE